MVYDLENGESWPRPAKFYVAIPLGRNGEIKAGKNSDYFIADRCLSLGINGFDFHGYNQGGIGGQT